MTADPPIVGRPLDRDVIKEATGGFLVTCGADVGRCEWQGLFPDRELAVDAINTHVVRERRRGHTHAGQVTAHLVEFLADDRAACITDSHHVYIGDRGPDEPLSFEPRGRPGSSYIHELNGYGFDESFPVTPSDHPGVDELVEPGDLIETSGGREGKVYQVTETRSLGLPTWTIVYVAPEQEWPQNEHQAKQRCKWLNELVAVDGEIVCRYGDHRTYSILGRADDFQAMLSGGWSA